MKVSELDGSALDYLVQCAEKGEKPYISVAEWATDNDYGYRPSSDWSQGGPIIERESIELSDYDTDGGCCASIAHDDLQHGPTVLIAAMRCYVASVFGDEVPDTEQI